MGVIRHRNRPGRPVDAPLAVAAVAASGGEGVVLSIKLFWLVILPHVDCGGWVLSGAGLARHPLSRVVGRCEWPWGVRGRVLAWLGGELAVWSILLVSIVGLSRVWPLYALNRKGLGPGAWVGLLGHPLPVCAKGADAGWSGLVHAHGRAAHARGCHASCHAGRVQAAPHGGRPPRPGLVHELAVIRLGGTHLERGTHLQWEKKKKKVTYMTQIS